MRNACLIDIRRCKMRGAYLVRSSQGAPEADITPELGNWKPPHGRAANQNAANFSYAPYAPWSLHWRKSSEPIDATRRRASRAADRLCALAAKHGTVVVVAHRTFNRFLATQLLKRGWRGPRLLSGAYWSSATYVRNIPPRDPTKRA